MSMGIGPSEHLTWTELACKDGSPYPYQWTHDRGVKIGKMFEDIRGIYNKPIRVLSAYRSSSHNRSIGGALHSQHVEGRALDLKPPAGITVGQFFDDIRTRASAFSITGIGKYASFVHVDFRPSSRLVVWNGSGVKDGGI